ncbi:hypothetical protein FFLO_06684 [Filobasidium floriforme]|uniref:Uncharacterized protein n=1 Tax=Filobasidium floriforme TaxID=5210 RepID=A0A8K0JEX6_9TREE|nr:uncharacterized protein HD553DRAFT_208427 [Filobasidium floriforme]KAG7527697.1 hypothetical protein FFLO_06684 [Filobasidium floriforme]KAH8086985.1 hypothetical protein HD553DRAFT_208427 [Filobasidium floriforme]
MLLQSRSEFFHRFEAARVMNDDTRATTSTTSVSSSPSTSSATESPTPYTDLPTSSSPAVDKEAAEIGKVPQSSQVAFISAQRQLVPPSNNYTSTPRTLASPAEFTPLPTPSDHHSVQPDVIDHQTSDNRTNHEEQGDPRQHDLSPTRLNRVDSTDIDRASSSTPIHSESGSKLQDDQPVLTRTTITDRHGSEGHSSEEASDRSDKPDKPALQNDVTGLKIRIEHTRPSVTGEATLLGNHPSRLPTASTSSSDTETVRAVVEENGEITSDALPTNEGRGFFSSTRTAVTTPKQQQSKLSALTRSQSSADDLSEQRSIGSERDSFPVEQRSSHHDSHTIIITSPDSATPRETDLPSSFHVPGQGDRQLHQDTPGQPPSQEQRHNRTTDTEDPLPEDVPSAITHPIPAINLLPPDISVAATQSRLSLPPTSSSSSSSSQGVAQGGGMNEGPGLVADSGRSIREYARGLGQWDNGKKMPRLSGWE